MRENDLNMGIVIFFKNTYLPKYRTKTLPTSGRKHIRQHIDRCKYEKLFERFIYV